MHEPSISDLSNEAIEHEIAELSARIDAAEHRLLALIRELDARQRHREHGLATAAAWLGFRVGLGPGAAREKVRVAKALGDLPLMDAALSRGEVSYSKVRAMTRIATPDNEPRLLQMAKDATAAQLEKICRGVAQVTETSRSAKQRWLRATPCTDGMVRLEARLHPDEAALVLKAVTIARDEASAETSRPTDVSAETSDPAASKADALVRVVDAFVAGQRPEGRPGGERHQILVCVRADAFAPGGVSAETEPDAGHLTPDTLRRLACDATLTKVLVDEAGEPLDVGHRTRTIPPAIRRALKVRDRGCRFPGCTNTHWVDVHHVDHWMDGGSTSRDNLVLLCTRHHQLVHEGGFTLTRESDALVFRRPNGTIIRPPDPIAPAGNLPDVRAPRPPCSGPPDYNWAIGLLVPRAA